MKKILNSILYHVQRDLKNKVLSFFARNLFKYLPLCAVLFILLIFCGSMLQDLVELALQKEAGFLVWQEAIYKQLHVYSAVILAAPRFKKIKKWLCRAPARSSKKLSLSPKNKGIGITVKDINLNAQWCLPSNWIGTVDEHGSPIPVKPWNRKPHKWELFFGVSPTKRPLFIEKKWPFPFENEWQYEEYKQNTSFRFPSHYRRFLCIQDRTITGDYGKQWRWRSSRALYLNRVRYERITKTVNVVVNVTKPSRLDSFISQRIAKPGWFRRMYRDYFWDAYKEKNRREEWKKNSDWLSRSYYRKKLKEDLNHAFYISRRNQLSKISMGYFEVADNNTKPASPITLWSTNPLKYLWYITLTKIIPYIMHVAWRAYFYPRAFAFYLFLAPAVVILWHFIVDEYDVILSAIVSHYSSTASQLNANWTMFASAPTAVKYFCIIACLYPFAAWALITKNFWWFVCTATLLTWWRAAYYSASSAEENKLRPQIIGILKDLHAQKPPRDLTDEEKDNCAWAQRIKLYRNVHPDKGRSIYDCSFLFSVVAVPTNSIFWEINQLLKNNLYFKKFESFYLQWLKVVCFDLSAPAQWLILIFLGMAIVRSFGAVVLALGWSTFYKYTYLNNNDNNSYSRNRAFNKPSFSLDEGACAEHDLPEQDSVRTVWFLATAVLKQSSVRSKEFNLSTEKLTRYVQRNPFPYSKRPSFLFYSLTLSFALYAYIYFYYHLRTISSEHNILEFAVQKFIYQPPVKFWLGSGWTQPSVPMFSTFSWYKLYELYCSAQTEAVGAKAEFWQSVKHVIFLYAPGYLVIYALWKRFVKIDDTLRFIGRRMLYKAMARKYYRVMGISKFTSFFILSSASAVSYKFLDRYRPQWRKAPGAAYLQHAVVYGSTWPLKLIKYEEAFRIVSLKEFLGWRKEESARVKNLRLRLPANWAASIRSLTPIPKEVKIKKIKKIRKAGQTKTEL